MKKLLLLLVILLLPMMAKADSNGTCGDNLTWTLVESTGTLTISGFGAMNDYTPNYPGPWYNDREKVLAVVIEDGVTTIGNYAFLGYTCLNSVTIGNSLTNIGISAFASCSGLKSVYITDLYAWCNISFADGSSNPIGDAHHLYLDGVEIKDLVIPNNVTCIGDYAFYHCSGLTSITIPNSVTSIGEWAFSICSGLTSITIPNSVTSIGEWAFYYCSGLTSITIPNSVTSIGEWAFSGCSGLTSLTIPNSVTTIGNNAFQNCSGLTSITIPNSITSIGNSAFSECSGLTSITIPNSVTRIGDYAFKFCSGLTSITIPNSVTSIGNSAFYYCSGLTFVSISKSVTSIGGAAFIGCSSLSYVSITDIESWCKISFSNFTSNPLWYAHHLYLNGSEITNLYIPNSVTSIGNYAFYGCSGLTSVTIPNSVTSIETGAFQDCSGLTSITIPNSVMSIGESAFVGCKKIENVDMPDDLSIIKKQTFKNCSSLKTITIPSKVEFIYQEAFAGCNALESVRALPTTPPFLYSNSFSNYDIPLYVPEEAAATYQSTSPWSNFTSILTLSGDEPQTPKCATPTIKYIGGKLLFECETEGVEFVYSITTPANTIDQTGNNVDMPHTNIVSVYAKKEGYLSSDVATEDIDVRGIQGDTNRDGVVTVADAVRVVNILLEKNE